MTMKKEDIYSILGYEFKDESLLKRAFTLGFGDHLLGYERLEFLGDRVLGLIIADMLYKEFPNEDEGDLARRFSDLVKADTLARVAMNLNLDQFLILGNPSNPPSLTKAVMSDICEAVIAALYLDGGLEVADRFIEQNWEPLMEEFLVPPIDAKTQLQEIAQGKKLPLPRYTELNRTGPDHAPVFTMQVEVKGYKPVAGQGKSKREAEQAAAADMLKVMEN